MGHSGSVEPTDDSARAFLMMATENQRNAFVKCMETTERVQESIGKIGEIGTPWSRGRRSYDQQSLKAFAEREEQLDVALKSLTEAHQAFWRELSEAQKSGLERQLRKLDQVQSELDSSGMDLSQLVLDAKPGPSSPRVRWVMNTIEKDLQKWNTEHKKIAKAMNIPL